MQQYAVIYLLQNHSTCFGCPSNQSSGVHKTATAASGTGHRSEQQLSSNVALPRQTWDTYTRKITLTELLHWKFLDKQ